LGAILTVSMASTLVLAGWLAFQSIVSERTQIEQGAHHRAREITTAIEREIISNQNLLTALASSHLLLDGQLEQFYRQAVEVAHQLNIQIVLRDARTDQYLFNTAFPWDAPLPQVAPASIRDIAEQSVRSGKPTVSGVFFDPLVKNYLIAVLFPVMREGTIAYFLCVGLPLDNFAKLLDRSQMDDNWIATIIDRAGMIVARSKQHNEFAGNQVPIYPETPGADAQGVSTGTNIEGVPFHWFNSQSQLSGWRVSVGVPDSALTIPLKRALVGYGGVGALLLAAGTALSYFLGNRLSQSFGALGIDRKPTREEFSALFEHAPNGVVVIDSEGLIALLNVQIESMFGYDRDELVGRPLEMLVPERLRRDHSQLRQRYKRSPATRPMGPGATSSPSARTVVSLPSRSV
jgi:PAS domain-containing protein